MSLKRVVITDRMFRRDRLMDALLVHYHRVLGKSGVFQGVWYHQARIRSA